MTTETAPGDAEALLTLRQIAALAQVERPVVTVWRKRPHRLAGSFPEAARHVQGQDYFRRDEVVTWLQASNRGKNSEVALDAALHSRPPIPTPDGLSLAQALLSIHVLTGTVLAEPHPEDLRDLADEVDPDDLFAASECLSADDDMLRKTAHYIDELLGATYGPEHALTHLSQIADRFGVSADRTAAAQEVIDFVGALVAELSGRRPIAEATGCGPEMVLASVTQRTDEPRVLCRPSVPKDDATTRAAVRAGWRTLRVNGVAPEPISTDQDGHIEVTDEAMLIGCYPHAGAPRMTSLQILEAIHDVTVQLDQRQTAVIVGPAGTLVDRLAGREEARVRQQILGAGRVRALIRFGFHSTAMVPQQRLALWVIGAQARDDFRRDGRTAVADLSEVTLGDVAEDLIADIVAAIADRPVPSGTGADETEGRLHRFRVARYRRTSEVLAGHDLVPRGIGIQRRVGHSASSDAESALLADRVAHPLPGLHIPFQLGTGPAGTVRTVRDLLTSGQLKQVGSCRLTSDEWQQDSPWRPTSGTVTVIGTEELVGQRQVGERTMDLFAFTKNHPRNQRTEAGDVVFCTSPRPAVWVDHRGGSVVEYPARVLRPCTPEGATYRVIPEILAADLTAGSGRTWQAFRAGMVPTSVADEATTAMAALGTALDDAARRVNELTHLTELLANGLVAGQVTAMMETPHQEGH